MTTRDLNLKPLFNKLGHNLEEIRVRSLDNILSKLEHNLVCDADIVQEKHLHIRLLEWFNFPSCPRQEEVLALILRLSKHPSAAAIYLEVGGVEFLTQLRQNVDQSLHKLVDNILDNLFHLPSGQHMHHTQECIYKQRSHTHAAGTSQQSQSLPTTQALQLSSIHPADRVSDPTTTTPERQTAPSSQPLPQFPSPPDSQAGYFGSSVVGEGKPHGYVTSTTPAPTAMCFKFSTFPWVALTPPDRHVLSSTDNSLKAKDVSLVVSACEFLSDVVFQDFPAEVFLQRPSIIKSLLSLLEVPRGERNVALPTVCTLKDLATSLHSRIYYYQDPAVYTPKQDFTSPGSNSSSTSSFLSHSLGSSDTRPSVIGRSDARHRGDGRDGDSTPTSGSSLLDGDMGAHEVEDLQTLQFMQWTTPQFCSAVLDKLLPCLKTPDENLVLHALELLHQVAALLKESVAQNTLWEDGSLPARELIEKFQESLEMLADVIQYHHHSNLSVTTPAAELSQHRIAYVGTVVYTVHLLQTLVPLDKVQKCIPEDFSQLLTLMCEDESLAYSYPSVRQVALQYLQLLDADCYEQFIHAQRICRSLESTCSFLMESDDMVDENLLRLLTLAQDACLSLPYHTNMLLVERCVQLASFVCKKTSPNPAAVQQSRTVLLAVLAHPTVFVRQQAYQTLLAIIKDALGVTTVAEPTSASTQAANCVVHRDVLYQLCCFGMNDSDSQVQKAASEIVLYLLQCQLLVPVPRWQHILDVVMAIMPVLQGHLSFDTTFGKCILGLLEAESQIETGTLPLLEKFRGVLRCMYSPELRLRAEGLSKLAWFLAHEDESLRKLPLFSELNVDNLTNLFVVESSRSLVDEDGSRSVFLAEGLEKVYNIFISESAESSVQKSAAEQLAVVLQDPHLHSSFLSLGGLQQVLSRLHSAIKKSGPDQLQNENLPLVPALVKILCSLVQYDYSLRHRLAHDAAMYYTLLRCGMLFHKEEPIKQQISELMAYLLFDEVAAIPARRDSQEVRVTFSLPEFVVKRYNLPFKPAVHNSTSIHQVALPDADDPLTTGSLAEMLALTWNVAWQDGIEAAVKFGGCEEEREENLFDTSLHMTAQLRTVLATTYIPYALQHCVNDIENATSHAMVSQAILRLSSYMVASGPHSITKNLHKLNWTEVISRFLTVVPSSTADEHLLIRILHFFALVLNAPWGLPEELQTWLTNMLHFKKGALLSLMGRTNVGGDDLPESTLLVRRQVNRQLLKFVQTFIGKCPYYLADSSTYECVRGELTKTILTRINRTDAAHFYNLASLESTLACLMQVTARPGWSMGSSSDSLSLCLQMLHSLLEVISAFHIGRGEMDMSYMGRGVTRCATLCLRHLAFEMATQLQSRDWPRNWLFSRQATADSVGESGLHWLIPLWRYRDTEVRAAGVGIAVALASTESGRITMTTQCQDIPGGIWGAAFSLLLDQTECSLVRQQAALLLVNMTSQPMPSGSDASPAHVWQGPIVRNEETQVSLVGLSALLALLHHSQFYQEMALLLSNYYPQPAIHPVSVAGSSVQTTPLGSQITMTTSVAGSGSPTANTHLLDASVPSIQVMTSTPASDSSLNRRPSTVGHNGDSGSVLTGVAVGPPSGRPASTGIVSGQTVGQVTATSTPASMLAPGMRHRPGTQSPTVSETSLAEYNSVSTPCLVSSVCQLLYNLVSLAPQDTLICIHRENIHHLLLNLVDVNLLQGYAAEVLATQYKKQFVLSFQDLLGLHSNMLRLLQLCTNHDPSMRAQVLDNKVTLKQVIRLLGVAYQDDADTAALCEEMWEATLHFFIGLFQQDGPTALAELSPIFIKHWSTVAGRLASILQDQSKTESSLWLAALQFLAILLSEEGKVMAKVSQGQGQSQEDNQGLSARLDSLGRNDDGDMFSCSSGSLLCQALVKAYDSVALKPLEQLHLVKTPVINALKSLLAVSSSAKTTALEVGLVETICEHIKHLNLRLNRDALNLNKPVNVKKKDNPTISELILTFDLLRNFMYGNSEVKLAAYDCSLGNLIHRSWAWCQVEPPLMSCALALLCTFTARCSHAGSSLAFTSAMGSSERSGSKSQHSSNSLVHCVIKLVQREAGGGSSQLLKAGFALLSTLALSQECRGIMWKSNFLQEFSGLTPKRSKKSKLGRVVEGLWLDLLVSISFFTEGQSMILRLEGSISLLLDFGQTSSEHNQRCALLVLRNMCFHASNKPKLLTNEKLLPFLLRCIEEGSTEMKSIATSALWALVHNSQKAKVTVKDTQVMRKLQDAYNHFANIPQTPWAEKCAQNLHNVIVILQA